MNRGDCCGNRIKGAKVFIGDNLCGTIEDPKQGKWLKVKCRAEGDFIKIQNRPGKHLNFCGLKVWAAREWERKEKAGRTRRVGFTED